MRSDEKLILVKRYLLNLDIHVKHELDLVERSVRMKRKVMPEDVLRLYRARIRCETFNEFARDLEKLIYDNYRGG